MSPMIKKKINFLHPLPPPVAKKSISHFVQFVKKNIFPTNPLAFGQNPLFSRCKSIENSIFSIHPCISMDQKMFSMDQKMFYLHFSLKTES